MAVKWVGQLPRCDICDKFPVRAFVDGKTRLGGWAVMCEACYENLGAGLGLGFGQKYDSKTLEKLEG